MAVRYDLSLTLRGPVMPTGLMAPTAGIDTPVLRDHRGRPIIPGTQIRGVLRHVIQAMAESGCKALPERAEEDWFGRKSGNKRDGSFEHGGQAVWEPRTGRLRFSDLVLEGDEDRPIRTTTRIEVGAETGSVVHGSLQVLETPLGVNEEAAFCGTLDIEAETDAEAEAIAAWLREALKLVPAIGAHKSAGFGRVYGFRLDRCGLQPLAATVAGEAAAALAGTGAVAATLDFDGPFLVSATAWSDNSFKGSEDVPGAAIKAVLARALPGLDPDTLAGAVIREFRPAMPESLRPSVVPTSWFFVGGVQFDALKYDPEGLSSEGAVTFRPDWKPGEDEAKEAAVLAGRTFRAKRHVRTRTSINRRGTAKAGALFSVAAVEPADHVWKGAILQGCLSADRFQALIAALPDRLHGIGKMRTTATLSLEAAEPPRPAVTSGRLRIVLETPAALHTPDDVARFADIVDPGDRLRRQYQSYFAAALADRADDAAVAPETLALRFMASQRYAGGYLAGRYRPAPDRYEPWLLTEAGAVFELTVPTSHAAAVESFAARGLPPPAGFDAHRRSWQGNPFVPENGYGEARIEPALGPAPAGAEEAGP